MGPPSCASPGAKPSSASKSRCTTFCASSGVELPGLDKWSDAHECAVCKAALGKRKLNPRHHCRMCKASVCAACSPNRLKKPEERDLQRVCAPCAASAWRQADAPRQLPLATSATVTPASSRWTVASNAHTDEGRQNESECAACLKQLGKRKLAPRHHCRLCKAAVCANCSPSRVQLAGHGTLQRVCTTCASKVWPVPAWKQQLSNTCSIIVESTPVCSQLADEPFDFQELVAKLEVLKASREKSSDSGKHLQMGLADVSPASSTSSLYS